jgi:DnaJ-class molecular chaperone
MSAHSTTDVDLDAWECPDCGGAGRVSRYHKVTHQLGTDELPFWDECESCEGVGYCGPDAEARAKAQEGGAA